MCSNLVWVICLLPVAYYVNCAWCLWNNIVAARKTEIPYVIVPRFYYNTLAGIALRVPLRLLNYLDPESKYGPESWRHLLKAIWPWNLRYAPFKALGTDTFLVVSPGGLVLMSADADVITQITTRNSDFLKETRIYKPINIYGRNIVSSEGAEWRQHRKATSISFTEKTNRLVWTETLEQTLQMLRHWSSRDEKPNKSILSGAADTMRLSLHVMSRAGLGRKMEWLEDINTKNDVQDQDLTTGHSMNFTDCLSTLLQDLLLVMVIPQCILKHSPFKRMRRMFAVYHEFGKYMHEMIVSKQNEIEKVTEEDTTPIDVISQLVKGTRAKPDRSVSVLTDAEVVGNLFVFIVAGHETSASSIHFALLLLALNPTIQQRLQKELDLILGNRPPSTWSYDTDLPRLQNSLLQAVVNEQLRMIPPTLTVPKLVANGPQTVEIEGKEHVLPQGTRIRICITSVHRNPKYWPAGLPSNPSKEFFPPCDPNNDLEEFKPERWMMEEQRVKASPSASPRRYNTRSKSGSLSFRKRELSIASHAIFNPKKGSYMPFSQDARGCLGKRFAIVEILATLAAILSTHTIELGVEELVSEAELANMDSEAKKKIWEKARDKGNRTWQKQSNMIMTLALRGKARIPFTVVKRGDEVFGPDVLGER